MCSNKTDIMENWVIKYSMTTKIFLSYHLFMFAWLESNGHLHVPKITSFMLPSCEAACHYTSYYDGKRKLSDDKNSSVAVIIQGSLL